MTTVNYFTLMLWIGRVAEKLLLDRSMHLIITFTFLILKPSCIHMLVDVASVWRIT